ncbi:MAG: AAA family ATPase [Betaproteobacteria bacterium]|nr:AAA family ATPase [Betaproteobacteria bacterium]
MHVNGRGFEIGEPKCPDGKPLYGLHRIVSNPDAVIWITEGEQKADALNKLRLVATTTGGATSAGTADWRPLRGRACTIWPDNDKPGKAYAGEVASILLGMGCEVQCVAVGNIELAEGEDVIQWLEAHPAASGSDLEGLPMLAPSPTSKHTPNSEFGGRGRTSPGCDVPPEAVKWLWKGWLAAGKFQILGGAPGTGKTTISMALAATVTTGGRWPDGSRAEQGNVVVWSGEDDPQTLLFRGWRYPAQTLRGCILFLTFARMAGGEPLTRQRTPRYSAGSWRKSAGFDC